MIIIIIITTQNNANQIKARIDRTQQNSKCRLGSDRDETINHIISECSKLAQRVYKTRHDYLGKVIYREMCKKFKHDHTNIWYMHNPAAVLGNDSHKLLWDFDIETDHLISTRRPDIIIINKKKENLQNCGLYCLGWPNWKKVKKRISTSTSLGNCKNYGTWRWQLYQSCLVLLVQSPKDYRRDWRTWRLEDEWRPSKLQHFWEQQKYW